MRIIGGQWRGRNIRFSAIPGLRPTPNRVRETLFNWLQTDIRQAVCLDLFSGTGALGFEALSRGAVSATLVEQDRRQVASLRETLIRLDADNGEVIQGDALQVIHRLQQRERQPYNLVFLDPPFQGELLEQCCALLGDSPLLKKNALIYLETNQTDFEAKLPEQWELLKKQKAGQVSYYLARVG